MPTLSFTVVGFRLTLRDHIRWISPATSNDSRFRQQIRKEAFVGFREQLRTSTLVGFGQ